METLLDDDETRVLGCLIEKQLSTPEYYPLTLNSLRAACNQRSNRDPVTAYETDEIAHALEELRGKKLVIRVDLAGSRVPKYKHSAASNLDLSHPELAVLCALLLRGAQTTGELRARTERMFEFEELTEVLTTLDDLASRPSHPMVTVLPRQPGKKERRYVHLLSGPPEVVEPGSPVLVDATTRVREERQRRENSLQEIAELKAMVLELGDRLDLLQRDFDQFKHQFE